MKKSKQSENLAFEKLASDINDDFIDMFKLNVNKKLLQKYFVKVFEREKIVVLKFKKVHEQKFEKAACLRDKELCILRDIELIKNDIKNGKLE